ncbi:MAG: hypothetical protein WAM89_08600 [Terriglobales bacterium]
MTKYEIHPQSFKSESASVRMNSTKSAGESTGTKPGIGCKPSQK